MVVGTGSVVAGMSCSQMALDPPIRDKVVGGNGLKNCGGGRGR